MGDNFTVKVGYLKNVEFDICSAISRKYNKCIVKRNVEVEDVNLYNINVCSFFSNKTRSSHYVQPKEGG